MNDKVEESLSLDSIKNKVNWNELAVLHTDTIKNINEQLVLVYELRNQYPNVTDDIVSAFKGLELSFKDLIRETINISLEHATATKTVDVPDGDPVELVTEFTSGLVNTDDAALTYINLAVRYINIQDKTTSLISLGWVDLFTKLKIPTGELITTVSDAIKEGEGNDKQEG